MMHLLLIEDDMDLGSAVLAALKLHGHSVEWLRRAADARNRVDESLFDCVLPDLGLPDGSGHELLQCWRREGREVPVIVITARAALEDRLAGLDSGADDFLVKPFAPEELLSRIHAVARRYARQASEVWAIGNLSLTLRTRIVCLAGAEVDLSPREFQLLFELAREPGAVVAKTHLAQKLEPLGDPVSFATVEMHVFNLRKKIGMERIRTVRGIGYAFQS